MKRSMQWGVREKIQIEKAKTDVVTFHSPNKSEAIAYALDTGGTLVRVMCLVEPAMAHAR